MNNEKVQEIISDIEDPDLHTDIVSLKLVSQIEYDKKNKQVSFLFRPASFLCPIAFSLGLKIKERLLHHPEIDSIKVKVENYVKKQELETLLNQS